MAIAQQYDQEGLDALTQTGRPIPGQSLTNSPDEPYPWEGPPEFTDVKDALDYVFAELLEEESLVPILKSIDSGVPISDITAQIAYVGFREGKWNPDMVLLIIEPLMYILMALAEKADIQYVIYGEEEFDDVDVDSKIDKADSQNKNLTQLAQEKMGGKLPTEIPKGGIPADIVKEIEQVEIPQSLMAKPEKEEQPQSLLGR
jgi:hypothetical protein